MRTAEKRTRSPLATQAAWLMFDRFSRMGIAFAVSIVVARQLDPALYGSLSYANATVGTLSFLTTLGLEAIVVRMLAQQPDARAEILASAIVLRATGALVLTVLAPAVAYVLKPGQPVIAVLAALVAAATLFQSVEVVEYWLRQQATVQGAVLGRQLTLLGGAVLRIAALRSANPLVMIAAVALAEAVAMALVLLLLYSRSAGAPLRASGRRMKAMFSQAIPLLVAAVAVAIYVRIGVLILGTISGTAQVGLFSVATLITEATHAVPFAIMAVYAPSLLQRTGADFEARWRRALRRVVLLGLALSAGVCVAALWLMPLLFGPAYAAAGSVLTILVWSAPFVFVSIASEAWFLKHDRLSYYPAKTALGALSSIGLNLALVPALGAHGAAIATVVSYSVSAYWSNALFPGTRELFRRQSAALLPWPRYSSAD
jgi:PST family polysaccharide transporter